MCICVFYFKPEELGFILIVFGLNNSSRPNVGLFQGSDFISLEVTLHCSCPFES